MGRGTEVTNSRVEIFNSLEIHASSDLSINAILSASLASLTTHKTFATYHPSYDPPSNIHFPNHIPFSTKASHNPPNLYATAIHLKLRQHSLRAANRDLTSRLLLRIRDLPIVDNECVPSCALTGCPA